MHGVYCKRTESPREIDQKKKGGTKCESDISVIDSTMAKIYSTIEATISEALWTICAPPNAAVCISDHHISNNKVVPTNSNPSQGCFVHFLYIATNIATNITTVEEQCGFVSKGNVTKVENATKNTRRYPILIGW